MANKPLQTIKFPGLTDTYTVPQVDSNFVGTAGQVPDSKKVHDEIDSLKEDLNAVQGAVESASDAVYDNLFSYASVGSSTSRANVQLTDSGLYTVNSAYTTLMFPVVAGWDLKIVSSYKCQFQSASTAPTSGDGVRVGDTFGDGTLYKTVPSGATHLAVCVLKTAETPTVYRVTNEFVAQQDRLLSDEELYLMLEKAKDDIREIDLSSYLFDGGREAKIARVVPATMASRLDGLNIPANYPCTRIGRRVLYLPKGAKVITNIDSFYDGTTFPSGTFSIGDYRGVILANIVDNGNTVTGTVAWGREKFDGRYRIIDITYTDYYSLFYRTDVSYTPKFYIHYPEKHAIESDDARVTDITVDVRMCDGYLAWNGLDPSNPSNWTDNIVADTNGSSGRYKWKTAMFHLTGNVGKSLYIDGMDFYNSFTGYQTIIKYVDNGDDTYTQTADGIIYPQYTTQNHDYITVPLSDKDDFRVQFPATVSPAYMRFLIVPNELLFERGLANPVFYGKKILGYGDSYIAGQGITETWHKRIAQANYGIYVNRGHGGAGLCFGASGSLIAENRISELDEDADIYFLCFGRNDNSVNIAIGDNDDYPDTSVTWDSSYLLNHVSFKAGLNYLFEYLETRHPYAKIVAVTPWGFVNNPDVTSGLSCLDYIDAMQEMCKKWGITCFNAAGDAGIHVRIEAFRTQYFLASNDQSHLNNDGHALMAKRASKLLTNLLYND